MTLESIPWQSVFEVAPTIAVLLFLVVYLIRNREKYCDECQSTIASLTAEMHTNTVVLERMITLLEVLINGPYTIHNKPTRSYGPHQSP